MAVDATTKKDGDSPLKSVSWSETTVAQVDDRCVQVAVEVFKSIMSGSALPDDEKSRKKLKKFNGIDTKDLPDNSESGKYNPLCNILNAVEILAGSRYRWKIVANHAESADIDHKPDIARYPVDIPAAKAAYTRNMHTKNRNIARCAWAWMNSYIEVKNTEAKSPFFFARNVDKNGRQKFLRQGEGGKQARGQFIKYVTEAMLRQHRTHYYSIYITEMSARVFRWDRVGCIASEPIDLRENPYDFLDILYRLATSPDHGGVDSTINLATKEEIAELAAYNPGDNKWLQEYHDSMLDDQLSHPIYRVSCPSISLDGSDSMAAEKSFLIGRYAFGHYSPLGRCTRGYPALDMETKRLVWFKDQWRCVARPHSELDAYLRLHDHNVPYIATPIAGGDVEGHRTISQDFLTHLEDEWRPSARVHTRLVSKEVGTHLETYRDSYELLRVCAEAFCAHRRAWQVARILHRDISVGNIMIDAMTRQGFLNDWDLCKYREDMDAKLPASEPSGISGTWAFKSALTLRYPRKPPELADDLESFIHVISFLAYRYHQHNLSSVPENDTVDAQIRANGNNPELMGLVNMFFHTRKSVGNGFYAGGEMKYQAILWGRPPVSFKPLKNGKRSLVDTFLCKAYRLLQEHYWSLDESELTVHAVREGDRASPDEIGDVRTTDPAEIIGEVPEVFEILMEDRAADESEVEVDEEDFFETAMDTRLICPFSDPKPVLNSHSKLASLFTNFAVDKHGVQRDLKDYRDDKLFDQYLNWRMVAYLKLKGPTGRDPQYTVSAESAGKRKREEEDDLDEEEAPSPPKKPTRAAAARTRQTVTKEDPAATKPIAKRSTKWKAAVVSHSVKVSPEPTRPQPKNVPSKPSTSRAAPKTLKSQPTKTATKKAASRKAQVTRKPSSPRRTASLKSEATGRARAPKLTVALPPAPPRRSARLASRV